MYQYGKEGYKYFAKFRQPRPDKLAIRNKIETLEHDLILNPPGTSKVKFSFMNEMKGRYVDVVKNPQDAAAVVFAMDIYDQVKQEIVETIKVSSGMGRMNNDKVQYGADEAKNGGFAYLYDWQMCPWKDGGFLFWIQIDGVDYKKASEVTFVEEQVAITGRVLKARGWFEDTFEDAVIGHEKRQRKVVVPQESTKEELDALVKDLRGHSSRKMLEKLKQFEKTYID